MEKFELVDKNGNKPGKWGTCGGKVDMGETIADKKLSVIFLQRNSSQNLKKKSIYNQI